MKKYKQQGFTIVELILYGALVTVFLTIVSQMFLSALDVSMESESYAATELDNRYIFSRIIHDVYRASAITEPAVTGVSSSTLSLTIGGASYQYASSAGNLVLTTLLDSNNLNSIDSQLSAFEVTRIGVASDSASVHVKVTLTARTVPESGSRVRTYETTIGLRP